MVVDDHYSWNMQDAGHVRRKMKLFVDRIFCLTEQGLWNLPFVRAKEPRADSVLVAQSLIATACIALMRCREMNDR